MYPGVHCTRDQCDKCATAMIHDVAPMQRARASVRSRRQIHTIYLGYFAIQHQYCRTSLICANTTPADTRSGMCSKLIVKHRAHICLSAWNEPISMLPRRWHKTGKLANIKQPQPRSTTVESGPRKKREELDNPSGTTSRCTVRLQPTWSEVLLSDSIIHNALQKLTLNHSHTVAA